MALVERSDDHAGGDGHELCLSRFCCYMHSFVSPMQRLVR